MSISRTTSDRFTVSTWEMTTALDEDYLLWECRIEFADGKTIYQVCSFNGDVTLRMIYSKTMCDKIEFKSLHEAFEFAANEIEHLKHAIA